MLMRKEVFPAGGKGRYFKTTSVSSELSCHRWLTSKSCADTLHTDFSPPYHSSDLQVKRLIRCDEVSLARVGMFLTTENTTSLPASAAWYGIFAVMTWPWHRGPNCRTWMCAHVWGSLLGVLIRSQINTFKIRGRCLGVSVKIERWKTACFRVRGRAVVSPLWLLPLDLTPLLSAIINIITESYPSFHV